MKLRLFLLASTVLALAGAFALAALLRPPSDDTPPATGATRSAATAAQVQVLEQQLRDQPQNARLLLQLGAMYMARARESGDPSFYALAGDAAQRALAIDGHDANALVLAGEVALARHDFAAALDLGERGRAANPDIVAAYGVLTDALVELGRYDEAVSAAQEMADRRPDYASYARVSYLRELHGDLEGAVAAMELAAAAGGSPFDRAWALVQLGNLRLAAGDIDGAAGSCDRASQALPGDAMVLAAQSRIAIARGDVASAESLLRRAVEQRPLPEYATALGELLESQGRFDEARTQYDLVRATQQLLAANGVGPDIEIALFEADHGDDPERAYTMALDVYARQPSIFAADALAWAAYKSGRLEEARRFIAEAIRLGTRDPLLLRHAAVIEESDRGGPSTGRGPLSRAPNLRSPTPSP